MGNEIIEEFRKAKEQERMMEIARDTKRMRRILRDHEAMQLLRKSGDGLELYAGENEDGSIDWCPREGQGWYSDPADAIIAALGGRE